MALWTPANLPTAPALWLDANDASTFTYSSGSVVSQWSDKSGNGRHVTNGTVGYQPIRSASVINSLPAVVFDGVDDQLTNATSLVAPYVLWMVVKPTVPESGSYFKNGVPTGGTGIGVGNGTYTANGSSLLALREGVVWLPTTFTLTSSAALLGVTEPGGTSSVVVRFNGTSQTLASASYTSPTGGFAIGGDTSSPPSARYAPVAIAEVIVSSGAFDSATNELIEGYLAWKWGTQASLPSGHAYSGAAPDVPSLVTPQYIAGIKAYDPGTSAEVTWWFSASGYDNAGTFYPPRIENPGNFSRAFAGGIGGRTSTSVGEITLKNSDGGLNGLADDYFDGRNLSLYFNGNLLLSASIETAAFTRDVVSLRLRDRSIELDKPFSTSKYAGDNALPNGTEGTADDLKDKYKPRILGRVALMNPVCVNTSKLIYQVSDSAVDSIANVYDAGAYLSRGADYTGADAATQITDMLANDPGGGNFRCAPLAGMFRLGGQPYGQVSASVVEKWVYTSNTAAGLIQRILTEKGYTSADWVAADFTTLDQKNAGSVGLLIEEGETTASVIDRICQAVGAWWGFDASGKFRVARFEAPTGTAAYTFTDADYLDIDRAPEEQLPFWSVTVKSDRNYGVQDRKSLTGVVPEDRAVWFAYEYREQKVSDAAVQTSRKLATEVSYDTDLNGISIAAAEAQRRLDMYKVRRDVVRITAPDPSKYTALDLGSTVSVQTTRFGYTAGKLFIVTGIVVDYGRNQVDFVLWG